MEFQRLLFTRVTIRKNGALKIDKGTQWENVDKILSLPRKSRQDLSGREYTKISQGQTTTISSNSYRLSALALVSPSLAGLSLLSFGQTEFQVMAYKILHTVFENMDGYRQQQVVARS